MWKTPHIYVEKNAGSKMEPAQCFFRFRETKVFFKLRFEDFFFRRCEENFEDFEENFQKIQNLKKNRLGSSDGR